MSSLAYAEQYGRCFACFALVRDEIAMECRDCRVELCEACHKEHRCPVPDQDEQNRIAGMLDDSETAVETARTMLSQAEDALSEAAGFLRAIQENAAAGLIEAELLTWPSLRRVREAIAKARVAA